MATQPTDGKPTPESDDYGSINDYLQQSHYGGEPLPEIIQLPDPDQSYKDKRRVVELRTEEWQVTDQVIAGMAGDEELFQRACNLSRISFESDDSVVERHGTPIIEQISAPFLRDRITSKIRLVRRYKKKEETIEEKSHPPMWLVNGMMARGQWEGIRHLRAVSSCPIIRPDGSVQCAAGYDAATRVYYHPPDPSEREIVIPEGVGAEDAETAAESLLEAVKDFPFSCGDSGKREEEEQRKRENQAAWLSGLLTPLARHAFIGPSPCFLTDSNVRGAGKGLLNQVSSRIITGHDAAVSGYCADAREMEKKITTIVMAGDPIVVLDNISGTFGNEALERLITSTRWSDRVLGTNSNANLLVCSTFYANGNNIAVTADMGRRCIHTRLDSPEENPESRNGFAHPHLLQWVTQNRVRLLRDAMIILVSYLRSNGLEKEPTPFGSFEGWSRCVRCAVMFAGLPDPCSTRAELMATADFSRENIGNFLSAWSQYQSTNSTTAAELLSRLYPLKDPPADPASCAMRSAIESIITIKSGRTPSAQVLGNKMKTFKGNMVGGKCIRMTPSTDNNSGASWSLFYRKS